MPAASGNVHEALLAALDAERIRNARRVNLVRVLAVALFLARAFVSPAVAEPTVQAAAKAALIAYLFIAVAIWLAAGASMRAGRWSVLAIGMLDVVLTFAQNWALIAASATTSAERAVSDEVRQALDSLPAIYVVLLSFSMLSLRRWQVAASGLVGTACGLALQMRLGLPRDEIIATLVILVVASALATYATGRSLALVEKLVTSQARRERLRRYLPPQVAEMIEAGGTDGSAGELRDVTVLFSDIRGFTTMAERLDPIEVVELLNTYHTAMTEVVFAHGGTLDKLIGDGLMAYFGAPLRQDDHAARAVACALGMQERLAAMNASRESQGLPHLRVGIGLHSGPVVLGDIGSPQQRDCTIVGDTVNVASRMEQLTKRHAVPILASDETRSLAGGGFEFRLIGELTMPGRSQTIQTCAPVARLGRMMS